MDKDYARQIAELNKERELFFAELNRDHQSALQALTDQHESRLKELRDRHDRELNEAVANNQRVWEKVNLRNVVDFFSRYLHEYYCIYSTDQCYCLAWIDATFES